MKNRNKTDDDYIVLVNNNVRQMNIRRLETAVKAVNRIGKNRSHGFGSVSVVWNDGAYHNMPAKDFLQWAAQQCLHSDAPPAPESVK